MRRLIIILMIFFSSAPAAAAPFFVPPKPEVGTLSNGIQIFHLEDRRLPIVEIQLFIRGGSLLDPKGKSGLASLMYQTLRVGGHKGHLPSQVEERLEFLGAGLDVDVDQEYGSLTLALHKKDLDQGLEILFGLIREPTFDPEQMEILRGQILEGLRREDEDPLDYALRRFPALVYGEKSPWGWRSTPASVKKIKRKDLLRLYKKLVSPNRILVAASGDLTFAELTRALETRTAGWRPGKSPKEEIPPVEEGYQPEEVFIEKKGLTQSTILAGHLGSTRDNPDRFALTVMNYILGGSGSLSSRVGVEIRVEGGQAYGAWSHFGFEREEGIFYVATQTASEQSPVVLDKLKKLLEATQKSPGITDEELDRAKAAILHSFYFQYETRFRVVSDLVRLKLLGYPDDYLEKYQKEIAGLAAPDVERVAKKYLHPTALKILVMGDGSVLEGLNKTGHFSRWSP